MTHLEQMSLLVEKSQEEELLTFLKVLDNIQKKELVPHLKKLTREYNEFLQTTKTSYEYRGTTTQRHILQIASFVCFGRADYEKSPFPIWIIGENVTDRILEWYCPDWFSDFINKQSSREFIPHYLTYERIMDMSDKGYVKPGKELLAKVMPKMIFESEKNVWTCNPQNLLKRKITLDEHIWYLFEVDTDLHYSDRWLNFDKKEKTGWIDVFIKFSEEKKIDRFRLLRETIFASNKNFNKVLSGWFIQLFTGLRPEKSEIISLQKELFSILNAPHSKVVNTALEAIKQIADNDQFDIVSFLDSAPVLLAADTKATVVATLTVLDKIAKKHRIQREDVVIKTCGVFVIADDDLQTKAAKIIEKYADKDNEQIKNELAGYQTGIMQNARKILGHLLTETSIQITEHKTALPYVDAQPELAEIPAIETIDDLMFLAAMAFDNTATWHFDQLPASLLKFQNEISAENIGLFEPALQRALKMIGRDFPSTIGFLDHMLAVFFIDYGIWLVQKYQDDAKILQQLFAKYNQKDGDEIRTWMGIEATKTYLQGWDNYHHDPCYQVHKKFLLSALKKIKKADSLPLISTPTHQPSWIAPEIFVERLKTYQEQNIEPCPIDLQMAIARCYLKKLPDAIEKAKKILTGEIRELCLFLFGETNQPKGPFTNEVAWMAASLSKTPKKTYPQFENFSGNLKPFTLYTGQIGWRSVDEEYTFDSYNFNLKKNVPVTSRRKIIYFDFPEIANNKSNPVKKLFSKFSEKPKEETAFIYDFFKFNTTYFSSEHNDIKRILLLIPGNPEAFLPQIANRCLAYPSFWSENDKRLIIATLQILYEIWDDFGKMAHFFVATCMLSPDKTVAKIAAEIWVKATAENKIDHAWIGSIVGIHEKIEFAPFIRFTDLVMQNMFRVSAFHDRKLQQLVENVIIELPDEPIKNLKKLVEIYVELLAANNASVADSKVTQKLTTWAKNATLKKLISRQF